VPDPALRRFLVEETARLLAFGVRGPVQGLGTRWLDATGAPVEDRPVELWVSARAVHVRSVGHLLGVDGSREVAERALSGLTGALHDDASGGWFTAVDPSGTPVPRKLGYDHAFVILAATSAVRAGLAGGEELLADALTVMTERFWEEDAGMIRSAWDAGFAELSPYRGLNENMHAVEAFLAAWDVTGDPSWLVRAARTSAFAVARAAGNDWRLPEHYRADWTAELEHHTDRRDDQFQPYGATVGHAFEWSRLLLQLEETISGSGQAGLPDVDWADAARRLYARARADGWARNGRPGFVYTTDWSGVPVVEQRLHWVVAEAVAAAAVGRARFGDDPYAEDERLWWDYVRTRIIDPVGGSWHHELDVDNRPAQTLWPGKPDLYHAVQATLIPRLPLAPSLATAIWRGLLT
jgi:mannose/cellobiose epimerase-like protein (N-acyl-D-glucosamine 2-epimerase family)